MKIQNSTSQGAYSGIIHAFKMIAKEEGILAFFKGLTARILWLAPSSAITMFACKCLFKVFSRLLNTLTKYYIDEELKKHLTYHDENRKNF
jgi:hypothetical protein